MGTLGYVNRLYPHAPATAALRGRTGKFDMTLSPYSTAARFYERAGSLLEKTESENVLMAGIALELARHDDRGRKDIYMVTIDEENSPIAAAMMIPNHSFMITRAPERVIEAIANDLLARGRKAPNVLAPAETAEAFARIWSERTGCRHTLTASEQIYRLEQVIMPQGVPGTLRPATQDDQELAERWVRAFYADAGLMPDRSKSALTARRLIDAGRLHFWEDNSPVSMVACSGMTANGARINFVYTPPELRRRGYASAGVAELSRMMLDSGKRFCFLFTDNPAAASIYRKLGYEVVCDFAVYMF